MGPRRLVVAALLASLVTSCRQAPPVREYTVVGQVVAVNTAASQITIRHEDIEGFMPGMTMPFTVKEPSLLDGRTPGDLVRATLNVQDTTAWISHIDVTGHAPLPEAPAPPPGLSIGDPVPGTTFLGQAGQPVSLDSLRGHPAVLTFTYTRCPFADFCPAVDARFKALQQHIASDEALRGVRLLSISLDPGFDRPPVLQAHAEKVGADPTIWQFVTGEPEAIASFGRQFGLDVRRSGSGPADIEHNLRTVVIDRDGRVVEVLTGARWEPATVAATLRALE